MVQGDKESPCSWVTHKTGRCLFKQGRKKNVIYGYKNSGSNMKKLPFDTVWHWNTISVFSCKLKTNLSIQKEEIGIKWLKTEEHYNCTHHHGGNIKTQNRVWQLTADTWRRDYQNSDQILIVHSCLRVKTLC